MDLTKFECSSFPMSYDDVVRLLLKVPPKPVPVRSEKQTGTVLRVLRVSFTRDKACLRATPSPPLVTSVCA